MKLARVNLEAEVWGDPRFPHLERLLGYPSCSGHLAIARMAKVWGWQVEHYTPDAPCFHVPEEVIEMALEVEGERAVAALVRANLAELTPDGVRVRGSSHEATGWLYRIRSKSAAAVDAKRAKAAEKRKAADVPQPQVHHGSTPGEPQVNPLGSLLSAPEISSRDRAREADPGLAELVDHAVDTLNAQRQAVEPGCKPIAEFGDQPGRTKLLAILRGLPADQRRGALDHALTVLGAEARLKRTVGILRLGMLAGDASWPRAQAETVASLERAARGRDGPAGRQSPARGQAIAQPDLPRTDGDVTL